MTILRTIRAYQIAAMVLFPLVLLLVVGGVLPLRQKASILVLQSSDAVVASSYPAISIAASPLNRDILYSVNGVTGNVSSVVEDGAAVNPYSWAIRSGLIAISSGGDTAYIDNDSMAVVLDPAGSQISRFRVLSTNSLGVLSNGDIVITHPTDKGFLHIFSRSGQFLRSFGKVNGYETGRTHREIFPKGKIVIDAADNIYYVFRHMPSIQKYSPTGNLILEYQVAGESIAIQQEYARRLAEKLDSKTPGGIDIINSAAVDRNTGHLWICMNGSSTTAVIYEYNGTGEKLHEYMLHVTPFSRYRNGVTGVKDIALTSSFLYLIDSYNQILKFKLNSAVDLEGFNGEQASDPPPPCGSAQLPPANCGFACPGPSCSDGQPSPTSSNSAMLDCKKAVDQTTSAEGFTVVGSNCTQFSPGTPMHQRGGCNYILRLCKDGVTTEHSATIDCEAPQRPPRSPEECQAAGWHWNFADSTCHSSVCLEQQYPCNTNEEWDIFACGCVNRNPSPIVIDVAGNGFDLTNAANGVNFDLRPDGIPERIGWTAAGSDDAWLALDRNGNGIIDNGKELFGNYTPQTPTTNRNGFIALGRYDDLLYRGNGDGEIDRDDEIFSSLRLWQDINHNGISEPAELRTLAELGIAILDLKYKESKKTDTHGNHFKYRAKVTDVHGAQVGRWAWDVFLVR
jgi:hypothetical protein